MMLLINVSCVSESAVYTYSTIHVTETRVIHLIDKSLDYLSGLFHIEFHKISKSPNYLHFEFIGGNTCPDTFRSNLGCMLSSKSSRTKIELYYKELSNYLFSPTVQITILREVLFALGIKYTKKSTNDLLYMEEGHIKYPQLTLNDIYQVSKTLGMSKLTWNIYVSQMVSEHFQFLVYNNEIRNTLNIFYSYCDNIKEIGCLNFLNIFSKANENSTNLVEIKTEAVNIVKLMVQCFYNIKIGNNMIFNCTLPMVTFLVEHDYFIYLGTPTKLPLDLPYIKVVKLDVSDIKDYLKWCIRHLFSTKDCIAEAAVFPTTDLKNIIYFRSRIFCQLYSQLCSEIIKISLIHQEIYGWNNLWNIIQDLLLNNKLYCVTNDIFTDSNSISTYISYNNSDLCNQWLIHQNCTKCLLAEIQRGSYKVDRNIVIQMFEIWCFPRYIRHTCRNATNSDLLKTIKCVKKYINETFSPESCFQELITPCINCDISKINSNTTVKNMECKFNSFPVLFSFILYTFVFIF
jgi:hypothetical protein